MRSDPLTMCLPPAEITATMWSHRYLPRVSRDSPIPLLCNGFTNRGIDDAVADEAAGSIYVEGRDIVIEGMSGTDVVVYTPDGRLVGRAKADQCYPHTGGRQRSVCGACRR